MTCCSVRGGQMEDDTISAKAERSICDSSKRFKINIRFAVNLVDHCLARVSVDLQSTLLVFRLRLCRCNSSGDKGNDSEEPEICKTTHTPTLPFRLWNRRGELA